MRRAEHGRPARAAHDRGITFFDTADMYSDGRSESMLGKAFGSRAEDVVISSKVGYVVSSRSKLMASAKSVGVPLLKRLGVVGRPSEGPAPSERPEPSEEPAPSEGRAMGHVVDERPQNFSPEAIRRGTRRESAPTETGLPRSLPTSWSAGAGRGR